MQAETITLSRYRDARDSFYIHRVGGNCRAQRLHVHDYFQIYYLIRGSITHLLEGQQTRLARGDVFIIPPGRSHRIVMGSPDTEFYAFSFYPSFVGEPGFWDSYAGRFLLWLQSPDGQSGVRPKLTIPAKRQATLELLMETAMEEYAEKRPGGDQVIRGLLTALLTLFARASYEASEGEPGSFENSRQFMLYCLEYIKNNLAQELTLDSLSRLGAMSRSGFCRLMREYTGMSFKGYLTKLRIDRATELMKLGGRSLSEIAPLCGYGDFSTFYRNFTSVCGMSPSEYRRIERQNGTKKPDPSCGPGENPL